MLKLACYWTSNDTDKGIVKRHVERIQSNRDYKNLERLEIIIKNWKY